MRDVLEDAVCAHYGLSDLGDAILNGLVAAGVDLDALSITDLAPVDEFHTAGRATTLKALELTPIRAGMHVIDAGCGIGGTARCLVSEYGCTVSGLDVTPEYIEVARMLTERLKLSDRCDFQQGSVLTMPFADRLFDAAISFHVAMNIPDRPAFYAELARVTRADAPLCIFDVMKGPGDGMRYPVPWAETEATSFLRTADETARLLEHAGFEVQTRENLRDFAIDFFDRAFAAAARTDGPPPVGLHLLTGANAGEKFSNYARALADHQIEPVIIVARRKA
jgi:MPBQ/MSBQ methyltransferase